MDRQYGAIPFVRKKDGIKVVLITSASGYWIFPKGRYEDDLGKKKTAEEEAFEEAGVRGRLLKNNVYRTKVVIKSGERVHLTLYALEVESVLKKWPEDYRRERRIVDMAEAEKLMDSDALIGCLKHFYRDMLD